MAKYINADELLQELDSYKFEGNLTDTVILAVKAFVSALPVANVRPVVHAHWINTGYENSTGNIYRCSYCEKIYNPEKKAVEQTRQSEKPQFCPACGAIMDENKTEE